MKGIAPTLAALAAVASTASPLFGGQGVRSYLCRVDFDGDACADFVQVTSRTVLLYRGRPDPRRPFVLVSDLYGPGGFTGEVLAMPVYAGGHLYVPRLRPDWNDTALLDVFRIGQQQASFVTNIRLDDGVTSLQTAVCGGRALAAGFGTQGYMEIEIQDARIVGEARLSLGWGGSLFVAGVTKVVTTRSNDDRIVVVSADAPAAGIGLKPWGALGTWIGGPALQRGEELTTAVVPAPLLPAQPPGLLLKTRHAYPGHPLHDCVLWANPAATAPYFDFQLPPLLTGGRGYFLDTGGADFDGDGFPEQVYVRPPVLFVGQMTPAYHPWVQAFPGVVDVLIGAHALAADFDGDGDNDLMVVTNSRYGIEDLVYFQARPVPGRPSLFRT